MVEHVETKPCGPVGPSLTGERLPKSSPWARLGALVGIVAALAAFAEPGLNGRASSEEHGDVQRTVLFLQSEGKPELASAVEKTLANTRQHELQKEYESIQRGLVAAQLKDERRRLMEKARTAKSQRDELRQDDDIAVQYARVG